MNTNEIKLRIDSLEETYFINKNHLDACSCRADWESCRRCTGLNNEQCDIRRELHELEEELAR